MITYKFFPKILFIIVCLLAASTINGQTLEADSTRIVETDESTKNEVEYVHSPKKATIYSAVLPGLGQAYNKKYWKIPLVYIGFGTIGYFIHWNNDNYKTMRLAYSDLTDSEPDGPWGEDDPTNSYLPLKPDWVDLENTTDRENFKTSISKQQDYYRRNRDLLIISIVGFYGIQIIDASVDAHLFDFDMSDDLSFNWQPTMNLMNNQKFYGINCTFTF